MLAGFCVKHWCCQFFVITPDVVIFSLKPLMLSGFSVKHLMFSVFSVKTYDVIGLFRDKTWCWRLLCKTPDVVRISCGKHVCCRIPVESTAVSKPLTNWGFPVPVAYNTLSLPYLGRKNCPFTVSLRVEWGLPQFHDLRFRTFSPPFVGNTWCCHVFLLKHWCFQDFLLEHPMLSYFREKHMMLSDFIENHRCYQAFYVKHLMLQISCGNHCCCRYFCEQHLMCQDFPWNHRS